MKIRTPKGMRKIGPNEPVFVIVEMSGNHNQDIKRAYEIIDAAAEAGADAIKLQTYTADTITIDCDKKYFQVKVNDAWKGQTLHSLYKKAFTPWDWQPKLKKYAEKKGLVLFSTPFDNTAVDFLEKMNVALYKVASFEVVDIPLLERIGKTKKPVIMSRGMASKGELELAVKTLKKNGCPEIAVLHCVSSYPAKPEEMNLATIPDIRKKFRIISGLSDHTLGQEISIASVALGASIIEKHLTLRRANGGPDAGFSLEPDELKELIKSIREIESAIGIPTYRAGKKELENVIFRKSLFVVKNIKKGDNFTTENIRSIRPGHGLKPKYYHKVIGQRATINIEKGEPLDWAMIKKSANEKYNVKKAEKKDCKIIWKIRNHPSVRQNSSNLKAFSFDEHKNWFSNKYFKNKNNFCYVLKNVNYTIGYCRFDYDNKQKTYVISIAINPKNHGKGLGNYLLSQSVDKLKAKLKKKADIRLMAEVKKNNISSIKLFERNGFEKNREDKNNYYFQKKLKSIIDVKSTKKNFEKLHDLILKEKPQMADAIIWLQGDRYDRAAKTIMLYKQGWSKRIIISGNNILIEGTRQGENNITLRQMKEFLLNQGIRKNDLIIDDGAMNTRDQAEHILKMAIKRKWGKIILVGSSYYQPRAFLTFLKQAKKVKWTGIIINQPKIIAWNKKPDGREKTAKLLFNEEFEKIKKYKKDITSIAQGIECLSLDKEGL